MAEPLVLSFDVGTQSLRAQLIDRRGRAEASVKRRYPTPYYSEHPQWAEQDADYYFRELCTASRELGERFPDAFARIECVTLTTFRDSYVCVDKEGKPLRRCILWLDQRKVKNPKPLPLFNRILYAVTGMSRTADMMNRECMCNWVRENEPEVWEKTDKFLMLSTYLNYRICGRMADSAASQVGHVPLDYRRRCWDRHGITRCLYDIPNDKLCELLPSGARIGSVSAECAALSGLGTALPVLLAGADKSCETLGLGALNDHTAALSFGTSCTVQLSSKKYFEPTPFMPAYPAVPSDWYNGEIELWRGYWMISWFKENFAEKEVREAEVLGCSAEELLDLHLDDVPPLCEGLMMLPHWTPSLTTPGSRGALIGFTGSHTRYHVYRAILEGLNFGLMEGLETMQRRSKITVTEIRLGGGGSRSDAVCQLTADMFGLPVSRVTADEASAVGAAMCAFVARGEFSSYEEAMDAMVHVRDTFYPDKEKHELYRKAYEQVYRKMHRTLLPLHRSLGDLTEQP